MNHLGVLIRPRILSFRHQGDPRTRRWRMFLIGSIGTAFWGGIFVITLRVLTYFQGVEGFGDILAFKLLSMVLMTFFGLLMFSAILTNLSKLYLSKDLLMVHALPVPAETIFFARWVEAAIDSAWMVVVYTLPVFISFGIVFDGGWGYYLNIPLALLPLCAIAAAISGFLVMAAVIVLPASRIRTIFVFLGLAVIIVLYLMFRMLKPERLVDPESFASVMLYLQSLQAPSSPWMPTTWALEIFRTSLSGVSVTTWVYVLISLSFASILLHANQIVARRLYFPGFSKSQVAAIRLFETDSWWLHRCLAGFSGPVRAFVVKEWKTFWRDQTQWSQLFLLGALVVIYLYNFSALPLERSPIKTIYLQNLFSFLNMALAAFVLTAIAARFAFPSVSTEGPAFWIVRSSPISTGAYLRIKFVFYLVPLLVMAEVLIVATNVLLQVTPFMMILSTITLLCMTPGVISLAVGLGAAYPNFASENPAQAVTGFGGLMFMIYSAAFIGAVVVLEAGPVYTVFMAGMSGNALTAGQWAWAVGSFALVAALCLAAAIFPLRFGMRRLAAAAKESSPAPPDDTLSPNPSEKEALSQR